MLIQRRGAKRTHRYDMLANRPAQLLRADGAWVHFELRGRYGVPDGGTSHVYTVSLSRDEIVAAVNGMLAESSNAKLSKPVSSLLRELLAYKKR
jgi:hypothetical protein